LIWTLLPAGILYGLIAALVFRRFTNREATRRTMNRMIAHILEFRLYLDSPALVFRAQRDLLRENLRLLGLIALPCALMTALFILLFPSLDAMYGHAPLRTGEPAVVTLQLEDSLAPPSLDVPAGIRVETPGMYVVHDRQISWRVRPLGNSSGNLTLLYNGHKLTKQIAAGSGLVYGWQPPFVQSRIDIRYPPRSILHTNWMVWFFLLSTVVAVAFK